MHFGYLINSELPFLPLHFSKFIFLLLNSDLRFFGFLPFKMYSFKSIVIFLFLYSMLFSTLMYLKIINHNIKFEMIYSFLQVVCSYSINHKFCIQLDLALLLFKLHSYSLGAGDIKCSVIP